MAAGATAAIPTLITINCITISAYRLIETPEDRLEDAEMVFNDRPYIVNWYEDATASLSQR
ncbi:MAG: hypothetical protein U0559_05295 [Anaerolineae bacterium]